MELTNNDIWQLHLALDELLSDKFTLPRRFAFRAALNRKTIEPIVDAIKIAQDENSNPEIADYNKFRQELFNTHCLRDADGQPLVKQMKMGGQMVSTFCFEPETQTQILQELVEKYPNIPQQQQQHQQEVQALLQESCQLELKQVSEDDLPDNLPGHLLLNLHPMLAAD